MTNELVTWLRRNQWIVLVVVTIVLVAGLAAKAFAGADDPPPLVFQTASDLPDGAPIRVHIAGAVNTPGVYELHEGDRVIEALAAAGGPADGADLDALNLARRVHDAEQVLVPGTKPTKATVAATLAPGQKLDINRATAAELDLLPGIGEAYSRRIVDSRAVDGPYKSVDDLLQRNVLPRATYEAVRDLLTVAP